MQVQDVNRKAGTAALTLSQVSRLRLWVISATIQSPTLQCRYLTPRLAKDLVRTVIVG